MKTEMILDQSKKYKHEAHNLEESIANLDRHSQIKALRRFIYKCDILIRVCDSELSKLKN